MKNQQVNPYDPPNVDSSARRTIGALTILLITLASVVAGVCTFFVSCFGVAIIGAPNFGGFGVAFILIWVVLSLVLALTVARLINKSLRTSAQRRIDQETQQSMSRLMEPRETSSVSDAANSADGSVNGPVEGADP